MLLKKFYNQVVVKFFNLLNPQTKDLIKFEEGQFEKIVAIYMLLNEIEENSCMIYFHLLNHRIHLASNSFYQNKNWQIKNELVKTMKIRKKKSKNNSVISNVECKKRSKKRNDKLSIITKNRSDYNRLILLLI
jgi:hypothetical protein